MVNVNKNIKSSSKVRPAAPKRRPRNQALNSSSRMNRPSAVRNRVSRKLNSSIDWSSGYDHESIRPSVTALVESYLASVGASDALLKIGLEENAGFRSEFNLGVYVYLKQDTDETIQEGLLDELTQKLRRVIMREYNWEATKEWIADNDYKMSVEIAVGDCYDNDTESGYEIGYHSGIEVECPVDFDSSRKPAQKTRMNCSADVKITTESGNEVSMSEIKVVQNPSTNELALYIPENDEDAIPEGFVVIGDVVGAGEESESADDDEEPKLDSSKRKTKINCSSDADAQAAREVLIKHAMSDGSSREDAIEDIDDFEKQNKTSVAGLPTDEEKSRYGDGIWTEDWEGGRRYFALVDGGYYEEVDLNSSNEDSGGKVNDKNNASYTRK